MPANDWRAIFRFEAVATIVFIPLVWLFIPESTAFLNERRSAGVLERINATLKRFALSTLVELPPLEPAVAKASVTDILKSAYVRTTMLLSFAYTFHALTFYFTLKCKPSIISDPQFAGQIFTRAQGAGVLAYANLGVALGGAVFG